MNKNRSTLIKILAFLFLLNSVSLFIYFSSNSTSHGGPRRPQPEIRRDQSNPPPILPQFSKPWPLLPSYLPWSQTPNAKDRSCEAYFGNGFTQVVDIAVPEKSGAGWFRCHYSGTLRSSVCEGGGIRMDPGKIRMSRGGEKLQEVIGRKEEEELPEFEIGAFQVETGAGTKQGRLVSEAFLNRYVPAGGIARHAMRDLIRSIQVADEQNFDCEEVRVLGFDKVWIFASKTY